MKLRLISLLLLTTAPAVTALDLNGDGMSDVWQRHHGIAAGNTAGDADADGQNNLQESQAGTNPTAGQDYFTIKQSGLNAAATSLTARWRSVIGKNYTLLQSDNLISWTTAGTALGAVGNETEVIFPVSTNPPRSFWRMRAETSPDVDADADSLADWEESLIGSHPALADTDGDRMPDLWEFTHQLNLTSDDVSGNPDADSLTNFEEYLAGLNPQSADPAITYSSQAKTLAYGADTRSYLLSTPSSQGNRALPLIIGLHGDGGDGAGFKNSLLLENRMKGAAIAVYVKSKNSAFEYWTVAGRDYEAGFITALINSLVSQGLVRSDRVFITGMSGGAAMSNAVAARLKTPTIRGCGIMSGALWSISGDIPFTANGGVAGLPPAILIWGENDTVTTYSSGQLTRNIYLASQQCGSVTSPATPAPTVIYPSPISPVRWASIPGMGHSVWGNAGEAILTYFLTRM